MRSYLKALVLWSLLFTRAASACPDIDGLVDTNCDGKLIMFFFGDSITLGFRDTAVDSQGRSLGYPGRLQATAFPHAEIRNFGKRGEDSGSGVVRAAMIMPSQNDIDYFVELEGVNDYYIPHHFAPTTKNNLLSIFRSGKNTGALSLLANLTAVRRSFQAPWVESVNEQISSLRNINFNSLGTSIIGSDGLHPTGQGYQTMAGAAAQAIINFANARRPIDSDGDGLYDYEEPIRGTSVTVADSDGDGILDGQEVWVYGSNPKSLDSDADGLSDNYEVFTLRSNPASPLPGAPKLTSLVAVKQ